MAEYRQLCRAVALITDQAYINDGDQNPTFQVYSDLFKQLEKHTDLDSFLTASPELNIIVQDIKQYVTTSKEYIQAEGNKREAGIPILEKYSIEHRKSTNPMDNKELVQASFLAIYTF